MRRSPLHDCALNSLQTHSQIPSAGPWVRAIGHGRKSLSGPWDRAFETEEEPAERLRTERPTQGQDGPSAGRNDAADYWGNLGLRIDNEEFQEAGAKAQSLAFTIRGVRRLRLLQVFKDVIKTGLVGGMSVPEVRQLLSAKLNEGLVTDDGSKNSNAEKNEAAADEFRQLFAGKTEMLDSVIRTNMIRAERAGQWRRLQRKASAVGGLHLVQYLASDREGVCEGHRSLHGLVRPHDDPMWQEFWPPNGICCACEVVPAQESPEFDLSIGQSTDEQVTSISEKLRREQGVFSPVEHRLLPVAESLTRKFKWADNTMDQHLRNVQSWESNPSLGDVLRERYERGIDVFATDKHNVTSRNEMAFDIGVLPRNMPRHFAGHVAVVTDSGYKKLLRDLIGKIGSKQADEARLTSAIPMTTSELRELAIGILKRMPTVSYSGRKVASVLTEFLVDVMDRKIWVGFEFRHSGRLHYFEMNKAVYIQHYPKDLHYWFKQRHGKREVTSRTIP